MRVLFRVKICRSLLIGPLHCITGDNALLFQDITHACGPVVSFADRLQHWIFSRVVACGLFSKIDYKNSQKSNF